MAYSNANHMPSRVIHLNLNLVSILFPYLALPQHFSNLNLIGIFSTSQDPRTVVNSRPAAFSRRYRVVSGLEATVWVTTRCSWKTGLAKSKLTYQGWAIKRFSKRTFTEFSPTNRLVGMKHQMDVKRTIKIPVGSLFHGAPTTSFRPSEAMQIMKG